MALVRDVALFTLPLVYVLGFLAWSTYALDNRLGFLVLSVPQYLVAGTLASIFLASAAGTMWLISSASNVFHRRLRGRRNRTRLWAARVLLFLAETLPGLAGVLAILVPGRLLGMMEEPSWLEWLGIALIGPAIGTLTRVTCTIMSGLARVLRTENSYQEMKRTLTPVLVLPVLLLAFGTILLPKVESEFGGAKPRTAILELASEAARNSSLHSIVEDWTNGAWTVRTLPLTVLATSTNSILARPLGSTGGPIYEIRLDIVQAIVWNPTG